MEAFLPNFTRAEPLAAAGKEPADPASVVQSMPTTNAAEVSPELLTQLQEYVEQTVVRTVSQAVTTVIPDVVEATLAKQQQSEQLAVQAAPTRNDIETYIPGRYQGQRPSEARQDLVGWLATGGIAAVMAGVAVYAISISAPVQTQRQSEQLTSTVTKQSEQLLKSSQQVLESKQRCGNFSLICTIQD